MMERSREFGYSPLGPYYLKDLTREDIDHWLTIFEGKTEAELEAIIAKHPCHYWATRIVMYAAALNNVLWAPFGAKMIAKGFEATIHLFAPNLEISGDVSKPVGWILASMSTLFYMKAIRPARRGALRALECERPQPPLCDRFKQAMHHPASTAFSAFNDTTMMITNYLGSNSLFLPISPYLKSNPIAWWTGFVGVHSLGLAYYWDYTNDLFYKGVAFSFDRKRPWLLGNICSDPARIIQVFLQGLLCATALKAMQNVGIDAQAQEEFGFSVSPYVACISSGYFYANLIYPLTWKHYYGASEKAKTIMSYWENPYEGEFDASCENVRKIVGFFGTVKHDPAILLPMAAFMGITGFYSYQYMMNTLVDIPARYQLAASIGTSIVAAGIAGCAMIAGERARVVETLVLDEAMDDEVPDEPSDSRCMKAAAITLSSLNGSADMAAFGGFAQQVITAPLALAVALNAGILATAANLRFGVGRMMDGFRGLCGSRPSQAGMYSRSVQTSDLSMKKLSPTRGRP